MFIQHSASGETRLVTSASDLTAASECEFAFLRRVDARMGRDVTVPPKDDPMPQRAARLGDAHEERVLRALHTQFGAGVVEIERADASSEEALLDAQQHTIDAMRGGAKIVFQATFFDPEQVRADDFSIAFIGFADFLERLDEETWQVQDTKLARRAKVTALMQLAAYAEQVERIGFAVSSEVVLILGDGARSHHKLSEIAPVFRARRERLHTLLLERARAVGADGTAAGAEAIAWGAEGVAACGRCEVCEPEIVHHRDPLLIAGMRLTQRDRLRAAGITTIDAVAQVSGQEIAGMSAAVLEQLALQARVQIAAEAAEASGGPPPVAVADPLAFRALPPPDVGDIFFDFEGDPLYREPGEDAHARWGIDYLFGWVDSGEMYTPLWAHDLVAERRALEEFLDYVAERRRLFPRMHIYHYATYERSHLLSIAARHGVREAEVDQLLREHVLVDLYPVVKRALRVGSRSYSIKKLEPLYMGAELRDSDGVTSGAQSVTEYAEASEALLAGDTAQRQSAFERLDAIADYNRYDCVSTLRLRDWLLQLAETHGYTPEQHEVLGDDGGDTEAESLSLHPLGAELAQLASRATDPRDRRAAALAGSAIDYYEREQKSFWWAHFARLVDPIEDWADTRDVVIVDHVKSSALEPWQAPTGRQQKYRRQLLLRGTVAPGSSLRPETDVFLVYDYPPPFAVNRGSAPGARATVLAKILERHTDGVVVEETKRVDVREFDRLPIAVTPGPPPRAGAQKGAIEEWGSALAAALHQGEMLADPVVDIMRREPPRIRDGAGLVTIDSAEALAAVHGNTEHRTIGAVVATLRKLDRSALPVQGPPGTGKTYLAAHVIRTLAEEDGWKIGVVAQSHKVVENVLEGVVAAGLAPEYVGKSAQRGKQSGDQTPPSYTVLRSGGQAKFLEDHERAGAGAVIGGTAWDFSNAARVARKQLDLLVIDEAGQFSLAPTIASSVAAERLLLLGDPQQLPQVSQGSHPEPVDASALGYLLGEHETIPAAAGYFLSETRRMRPELAAVVSELAYEGRLSSHPSAAVRAVTGVGAAGLTWHPVRHHGNSTHSDEEAEVVVELVRQHLVATVSDGAGERPLTEADLIVVAAYNAQVETVTEALAAAGFSEVRVGTVDRFQGQEAVIAIVTLAASSAADVPRGLEFLLMRNRLNVAISRAQWSAQLVSSDRLGSGAGLPGSAEALAALSGYLRLTELSAVAT